MFKLFVFFLVSILLLGALGLLLGADCLVVALIALIALVGLLQSIMGVEGQAPHTVR